MFQIEDYKNPVPSKRKAIQPAHGSKHIITEEARKSKNLLKSFWHGIAVYSLLILKRHGMGYK